MAAKYRIDLLYRAAKLIIELDSFRWHEVRRGRRRTRLRKNALTTMGYTVIEVDVEDLRTDGGDICRQVQAILYSAE
jgi:very-short-patch-repair endonuclease